MRKVEKEDVIKVARRCFMSFPLVGNLSEKQPPESPPVNTVGRNPLLRETKEGFSPRFSSANPPECGRVAEVTGQARMTETYCYEPD